MAEVDAFAKAFLLGEGDKVDSRQKVSPAASEQPQYKEKESVSDDGLPQAFAGVWDEEMIGEAAASSSGGAGPPRPERPGSPAPEAGAPSASQQKPSLCE